MQKKSLSDILRNGTRDSLSQSWNNTQAAGENDVLPPGEYVCRLVSGDLHEAKTGTPSYKLVFRVLEGDRKDRQLWLDLWLTPAALPQTKRDLSKLGVTTLEQLDQPVPPGMRCQVKVGLRRDDDGNERNRVVRFSVVGVDEPEKDAFAPAEGGGK